MHEIFLSHPFSRRAFEQPRGYPGDAAVLDFIYAHDELAPVAHNDPGRQLVESSLDGMGPKSIRARRDFFGHRLEQVVEDYDDPKVLSLACGYLREASQCRLFGAGAFGEFHALDFDSESLDLVGTELGSLGVMTRLHDVQDLRRPLGENGYYDFVYCAGLFDYLPLPFAQSVVSNMFRCLKPGGALVVANLLAGLPERGCMEMCMNWYLDYKTPKEMCQLTRRLEPSAFEQTFFTIHGMGFVEVKSC